MAERNKAKRIEKLCDLAGFCTSKGLVFQTSQIYGGMSGCFDYGPMGIRMKRNIVNSFFKRFDRPHENIIPMEGSIITNPQVWHASGHTDKFDDPIFTTEKGLNGRADHLIEREMGINVEGKSDKKLLQMIFENHLLFEGQKIVDVKSKNLMFQTNSGAYLRPETCQNIFCNAKLLYATQRLELPFGIFQHGKVFRNEISPGNFVFRCREFEQLELEYFFNPSCECPQLARFVDFCETFNILCVFANGDIEKVPLSKLVDLCNLNTWHLYWVAEMLQWLVFDLELSVDNLRLRQHTEKELSHYSSATIDIEYKFLMGEKGHAYKELCGIANRGNYDLTQHQTASKTKMQIHDAKTKSKIVPHVIEPSIGMERLFMALLCDGISVLETTKGSHINLQLPAQICPFEYAVLPLLTKSPLVELGKFIHKQLLSKGLRVVYDEKGAIGKRYARQDEVGTRWCLTVDYQTCEDGSVTIRDRNTKKQKRIQMVELFE